MSIHTLQLLNIPGNYKKGTIPYGPKAYIALESYSRMELPTTSGKKKVNFHILSPECMTLDEVSYNADKLIQELEIIRKQAKQFFRKEEQKRRKYSQSKGKA